MGCTGDVGVKEVDFPDQGLQHFAEPLLVDRLDQRAGLLCAQFIRHFISIPPLLTICRMASFSSS